MSVKIPWWGFIAGAILLLGVLYIFRSVIEKNYIVLLAAGLIVVFFLQAKQVLVPSPHKLFKDASSKSEEFKKLHITYENSRIRKTLPAKDGYFYIFQSQGVLWFARILFETRVDAIGQYAYLVREEEETLKKNVSWIDSTFGEEEKKVETHES